MTALPNPISTPSAEGAIPGTMFCRYMLPDQSEYTCQVSDITEKGAVFLTNAIPSPGQSIIAYLEDLGRIEATTGAPCRGGFEVHFSMRGARLDRLRQRIEWLRNKASGTEAEDRRHARYEPAERISQIALPDGRIYACEVIDISVSGAAIKTDVVPGVGTHLMLGKMRGRVVRYIDQGIAIEFLKQLDAAKVSSLNPV